MNTEQLRADFEAWAKKYYHLYNLDLRFFYDEYVDIEVQLAFEAYQAGRAALQSQDRGYSPRKIGAELFRGGFGISDIWGAVKSDSDMNEALSGYMEAKKTQEETRLTAKDIDKALVGIRPDNHPVAYRVLSDLKSAIDHARRVEGGWDG